MVIKDIVAYSQQSNDRNEEKTMLFEEVWWDWNSTLFKDDHFAYPCAVQVLKQFTPGAPIPTLETHRREITSQGWEEFFYRYGIPRTITYDQMISVWFAHYHTLAESENPGLNDGAMDALLFCKQRGISNTIVTASRDDIAPYLKKLRIDNFS